MKKLSRAVKKVAIIIVTAYVPIATAHIPYTLGKLGNGLERIIQTAPKTDSAPIPKKKSSKKPLPSNPIDQLKELWKNKAYQTMRKNLTNQLETLVKYAFQQEDEEALQAIVDAWPDHYYTIKKYYEQYEPDEGGGWQPDNPNEYYSFATKLEPHERKAFLAYNLFEKDKTVDPKRAEEITKKVQDSLRHLSNLNLDYLGVNTEKVKLLDLSISTLRFRGKTLMYKAVEHGKYEYMRFLQEFIHAQDLSPISLTKKNDTTSTSALLHDVARALSQNKNSQALETSIVEALVYAANHGSALTYDVDDSIFKDTRLTSAASTYMAASCLFGVCIKGLEVANLTTQASSGNDNTQDEVCPICIESLSHALENSTNANLWQPPCGHTFHEVCLKQSIQDTSKNCPICRKPVTVNDVRTIEQDTTPPSTRQDIAHFLDHLQQSGFDLKTLCNATLRGIAPQATKQEPLLCKLIRSDAVNLVTYVDQLLPHFCQATAQKALQLIEDLKTRTDSTQEQQNAYTTLKQLIHKKIQ